MTPEDRKEMTEWLEKWESLPFSRYLYTCLAEIDRLIAEITKMKEQYTPIEMRIGTFPVYLPTPREQSEKEQWFNEAKEAIVRPAVNITRFELQNLLERALKLLEGEE